MKDPICGMEVPTGDPSIMAEHDGKTYHFCSAKCLNTFLENPDRYVGQPTAVEGGGTHHGH